MRIFNDFYVYPWLSYTENNSNAVLIDGETPVLIDPGHLHLLGHVVEGMAKDGKSTDQVKMIICTHGHPDHIEAAEAFDAEVIRAISSEEYSFMEAEGKELCLMTGCTTPKKPFTLFLKEGTLTVGDKTFRVISTPGHSPGGICLYWEEKKVLLSGDTVFYMGVGRTDLPGGDMEMLGKSIERLATLDIEYLVPGHGQILQGSEGVRKNFDLILSQVF